MLHDKTTQAEESETKKAANGKNRYVKNNKSIKQRRN